MERKVINIPAVTYTTLCPLSFSEQLPSDLQGKLDPQTYETLIHNINVMLSEMVKKTTLETGGFLCCKTTHTMYHGTSDATRCVVEYLSNNNATLPPGHSMTLITTETPPIVCRLFLTCRSAMKSERSGR